MAYEHVYTCAHFPIQMFLYEVAGVLIVASLQPPEVQTVSICLEGCEIYNISVYVTEQRVADEGVIGSSSTEVSPLLGSGTMYMYTHITMYSRHTVYMYVYLHAVDFISPQLSKIQDPTQQEEIAQFLHYVLSFARY